MTPRGSAGTPQRDNVVAAPLRHSGESQIRHALSRYALDRTVSGQMNDRQLHLEDALRVIDDSGPLTTGALASELAIANRDAHILMLTAEANRLVYTTAIGEWAITDRGRNTIGASAPNNQWRASPRRRR